MIRGSALTTGNSSSATPTIPSSVVAGDTLFAFVTGGNQATSYTGTWTRLLNATGQEQQGGLYRRVATGSDALTLGFDGSDPHRIVVLALVGEVEHEIVSWARNGVAGGSLPAVDVEVVPGVLSGQWAAHFVGVRNGDAAPTSSAGSLTYSEPGAHPMGFWLQRTATTPVTIGIPARSGHFRATVRFFRVETTDWYDDSIPVPQRRAFASSADNARRRGTTAHYVEIVDQEDDDAAGGALSLAMQQRGQTVPMDANPEDPLFDIGGEPVQSAHLLYYQQNPSGDYGIDGTWSVSWLTLTRWTFDPPDILGRLPPSVYDEDTGLYVDPAVIDVEWEPTTTELDHTINVRVENLAATAPTLEVQAGLPLSVRIHTESGDFTTIYDPGYGTRDALAAAVPDDARIIGQIPVPVDYVDNSLLSGEFPIPSEELQELNVLGKNFAVCVLDYFSMGGALPLGDRPTIGNDYQVDVQVPYSAELLIYYAPRYRLIREVTAAPVAPVVRQYPRDDGRGLSSAPRIHPPPKGYRVVGGHQ